MPKFARGSDIDLQEAYGSVLDRNTAIMRNVRTKAIPNKVHHCEDKECGGGAPKPKCLTDLHFAFCLAPVIDEDPESLTFGEVVIHGERFAVLSPTGCAEHQYTNEYNLDLKDARNGRVNREVRWKEIFASFKAAHEEAEKHKRAEEASIRKEMGMTAHQRKTMAARRDNNEYQNQRRIEAARRARGIRERTQAENIARDILASVSQTVSNASTEGVTTSDTRSIEPDELAVRVGAMTDAEARSVLSPMWLHDQLFRQPLDRESGTEDTYIWDKVTSTQPKRSDLPVLSSSWLQNQLFPEVAAPSMPGNDIEEEGAFQSTNATVGPQLRRKETKQIKKQRAAQSRALARTMAENRASLEALERATKKAPAKKTRFA